MIKRSLVIWIAWVFVVSSFPPGLFAADEVPGAAVVDLAKADNQFAFDLYARYASSNDNIFFSPYSLSSALDMTYEGARGKTAEEMRAVLHLSGDDVARRAAISEFIEGINAPEKSHEISVANALWAQNAYPFLPDYLEIVTNVYFAEAKNMDFAADPEGSRLTINNWVSEKTKDRIRNLLPRNSIDEMTSLVLTNAVYFKGKWFRRFDKKMTQKLDFWLAPDKSAQADMMFQSGQYRYMKDDKVQMVELPYEGNDLSMIVVLPESKDMRAFGMELNIDAFQKWSKKLNFKKVLLILPRFKVATDYKMKDDFVALGMRSAFADADFSGMTGKRDLSISEIFHKAWIDVNEEGTEAAAATAVVMTRGEESSDFQEFKADHPFIFFIRERKTGHILFMGRVSDPTK